MGRRRWEGRRLLVTRDSYEEAQRECATYAATLVELGYGDAAGVSVSPLKHGGGQPMSYGVYVREYEKKEGDDEQRD